MCSRINLASVRFATNDTPGQQRGYVKPIQDWLFGAAHGCGAQL